MLEEIKVNLNLKVLSLAKNWINREGMITVFEALAEFPQLEVLDLSCNYLDEDCIVELCQALQSLPNLNSFTLHGYHHFSNQSFMLLLNTCNNIKCLRTLDITVEPKSSPWGTNTAEEKLDKEKVMQLFRQNYSLSSYNGPFQEDVQNTILPKNRALHRLMSVALIYRTYLSGSGRLRMFPKELIFLLMHTITEEATVTISDNQVQLGTKQVPYYLLVIERLNKIGSMMKLKEFKVLITNGKLVENSEAIQSRLTELITRKELTQVSSMLRSYIICLYDNLHPDTADRILKKFSDDNQLDFSCLHSVVGQTLQEVGLDKMVATGSCQ